MTSNALPKFELPTITIEEVQELTKSDERRSSLKPGLYETVITGVEHLGPNKGDSTWHDYRIVYTLAGDREVKDRISVPTSTLTFGEKASKYPLQRLIGLMDALGIDYDLKNLSVALTTMLGSTDTLLKKSVALQLDYMNNRIVGEGDNESRVFNIVFKNGMRATDKTGEVVVFKDRDAAEAYAKENGIYIFNGVSVKAFEKSANKNYFGKKVADAAW